MTQTILTIISLLTLIMIFGRQEKLKNNQYFIICLLISLGILAVGIGSSLLSTGEREYGYFLSQMPFWFISIYRLVREAYFPIFRREPEISTILEHRVDIIPTMIICLGTVVMPFLVDRYLVQGFL